MANKKPHILDSLLDIKNWKTWVLIALLGGGPIGGTYATIQNMTTGNIKGINPEKSCRVQLAEWKDTGERLFRECGHRLHEENWCNLN